MNWVFVPVLWSAWGLRGYEDRTFNFFWHFLKNGTTNMVIIVNFILFKDCGLFPHLLVILNESTPFFSLFAVSSAFSRKELKNLPKQASKFHYLQVYLKEKSKFACYGHSFFWSGLRKFGGVGQILRFIWILMVWNSQIDWDRVN